MEASFFSCLTHKEHFISGKNRMVSVHEILQTFLIYHKTFLLPFLYCKRYIYINISFHISIYIFSYIIYINFSYINKFITKLLWSKKFTAWILCMDFVLVASFSHLFFNKVSKSNIIYLAPLKVSVTVKNTV